MCLQCLHPGSPTCVCLQCLPPGSLTCVCLQCLHPGSLRGPRVCLPSCWAGPHPLMLPAAAAAATAAAAAAVSAASACARTMPSATGLPRSSAVSRRPIACAGGQRGGWAPAHGPAAVSCCVMLELLPVCALAQAAPLCTLACFAPPGSGWATTPCLPTHPRGRRSLVPATVCSCSSRASLEAGRLDGARRSACTHPRVCTPAPCTARPPPCCAASVAAAQTPTWGPT